MNKIFLIKYFHQLQKIMMENKEYLIDLDSIVGDGDLGLTMSDGFKAAYDSIKDSEEDDIGKLLYFAGKSMASAVPSTMGTLMASGLMQAGKGLKGKINFDEKDMITIFKEYKEGVANRGKAKIGEKTFLDGLAPAIDAMEKALLDGGDMSELAKAGVNGAKQGLKDTTNMVAVHGRAATRGEASRTLEDPGAAVAVLMMVAFSKTYCF